MTTPLPTGRQIARKIALVVALIGAAALLATQLPGLEEIPHRVADADRGWMVIALLLELASTAAFAVAFHGIYDRRTSARASTSMSMAVQGLNVVLPSGGAGGLAVGAVLLDRAGVPRSFAAARTVALFLVTSLVSFAAVVVAGFGAALTGHGTLVTTAVPAAVSLLVIAALFALPRGASKGSGRLAKVGESLRDGVSSSVELLRSGDRLVIGGAIGYFAFDVAALGVAFHAVGSGGLPIGLLVLAYTLGHGGAIIPIPGSAEGGLIGMFVLYGMSLPMATAAVLAYRALHAGVPVLLGVIALWDVRRLTRAQSSSSSSQGLPPAHEWYDSTSITAVTRPRLRCEYSAPM
jgi:uncharacterized membrane protein YbhN (UPF0104 family)